MALATGFCATVKPLERPSGSYFASNTSGYVLNTSKMTLLPLEMKICNVKLHLKTKTEHF